MYMLYLTLGWIRWKYITWKGLLWIASYNVKTCQDCHICCFFELSFATSPPGSPGHPGSEHISEGFWEGSEKVLKDFGKNDFGRLVWHSVWPLWPRSKFQGLDATGTKLYVANLPEDIQALIVRCCEKVVIAVVFVAHWQYGNIWQHGHRYMQ